MKLTKRTRMAACAGVLTSIIAGSVPVICFAQNAAMERHFGEGEPGAAAGTSLFNSLNPNNPLPQSGGNVIQDTMRNLGAQQSLSDAWSNAARSNAGLPEVYGPPAPEPEVYGPSREPEPEPGPLPSTDE